MLDPDIQGRLQALDREHLAALFDYMFGPNTEDAPQRELKSHLIAKQEKTPGQHRGLS